MLKRSITLGELITACLVVVGSVISFWISTNVRLSALEINKELQDKNYNDTKISFDKINGKLDELKDGQGDIKIVLERKQDRK